MKVEWVTAAQEDRDNIVDYIAAENPRAAIEMDELFSKVVSKLGKFPMLGHVGIVPGTRELIPHASYRLIYEVDPETDTVWIMGLVHTARLWPSVSNDTG
ncbi:MAG TPA: type II toxin-antitoxin system RelE/ParE family toxin [Rhodanobacteraceae bacterium]